MFFVDFKNSFEKKHFEVTNLYAESVRELEELKTTHEETLRSLEDYYDALTASQLENSNLIEANQKELENKEQVKKNFQLENNNLFLD